MSGNMQPPMWAPGIRLGHPLANGLVGYWPFWEGDGDKVMDLSGNGNAGTLTNMVPADDWVPTDRGWGAEFDGTNDWIDCGDGPIIVGDFTIAGLFTRGADNEEGFLVCKFGNPNYSYSLYVQSTDVIWTFSGGGNVSSSAITWPNDAPSPHFVAVSVSAAATRFHVDAAFESRGGTAATNEAGTLALGRRGDTTNFPWAGVDHWAGIWSRALTPSEIAELYANPYDLITPRRRTYFYAPGEAPPPTGNRRRRFFIGAA